MKTNFEKVREFHLAFGLPIAKVPTYISLEREDLRNGFVLEEFIELLEAQGYPSSVSDLINMVWNQIKKYDKEIPCDLVAVADALTDILYFVYGTALEYGIDIDACFQEVHRSNMSKLTKDGKVLYREDGKVLKSDQYSPPFLSPIIYGDSDEN